MVAGLDDVANSFVCWNSFSLLPSAILSCFQRSLQFGHARNDLLSFHGFDRVV